MCRIDFRALAMATIIGAACGIPDETLAPPLAPVIPPPPEALGRLELNVDTKSLFVGMKLRLHISAYGVWGRRMNSEDARVSSSNEAIVKLSNADIIQITFPASGVTTREKAQNLSLVGTGTAVLRVPLSETKIMSLLQRYGSMPLR